MSGYNVAILGATGAVGTELLKILAERNFPVNKLVLLAAPEEKGTEIVFKGQTYIVDAPDEHSFDGMDIALFAGGSISKVYAPIAAAAGAIVIDNSSAFRYDPKVPLVVPEVNPEDIDWHKGIIANPNCSTIQMVVALKPLHDYANIKRIIVSTYQAVSGGGLAAMNELKNQVAEINEGKEPTVSVFPYQIAFNLIPQIDIFLENDYTKEEMKMAWETQKMFHSEDIKVSATAVRVPVYRSHSEAITIETEKELTPEKARELLANAPGVILVDDIKNQKYPMPLYSSDTDEVYVGRIRKDISADNSLCLWVVADQIRKGAATNAVQIAELLIQRGLVK